jgi:hypothetical protein
MAEEIRVDTKVEKGVILLTVRYGQELLLKKDARERLSKELTRRYREILEKEHEKVETTSCVVKIQAEVAGSPLVRALFELWKEVVGKEGGQVICVNYPPDYIDSLTALGLPTLAGFSLASTEAEAIQKLIKN